ncbi:Pol polyprotein [Smittium culicis]|uniref:Pol polyprotein n=1 Tax=Smittium culicis TaxID=133412 RepID=A0A1R1YSW4_9FUNG|nr:Pol polyprotein [Smittium culicis]
MEWENSTRVKTESNNLCIELENGFLEESLNHLLALEKRNRDEKDEDVGDRNKIQRTVHIQDAVNEQIVDKLQKATVRAKKIYDIKMAKDVEKYSIKGDLAELHPNINFIQLLQTSPKVRNRFMEKLGLEPNNKVNKLIVTADGTKHESLGIVFKVPLKIAGYTFNADFLVMRNNLYKNEIIIPKDKFDVILSMENSEEGYLGSVPEDEEIEFFALAKEMMAVDHEEEVDPRVAELVKTNKDIFVSDISDLTQTDIFEHKIDAGDAKPIKLRTYRIPHNIQKIVREEIRKMEEKGIISECQSGWCSPFGALKNSITFFGEDDYNEDRLLSFYRIFLRERSHRTPSSFVYDIAAVKDDVLFKKSKKNKVKEVLHEINANDAILRIHNDAHEGINNTWKRFSNKYSGARLYELVKDVIEECDLCQRYSNKNQRNHELVPIISKKPFDIVGIDAIGPIQPITKSGNRYILTAVDYFSKLPIALAVPNINSSTMINFLLDCILKPHGVPRQLISDRGSNFLSQETTELYEYLGIRHTPTTSYRPQSNGQVKLLNQTLKNILAKQTRKDKENLDLYIWKILLIIRTMNNASTKYPPSEMLYGYKITLPSNYNPPA